MSRMFPFQSQSQEKEPVPLCLELGQDDADIVFDALSSETARSMLTTLYEEPHTPSELAKDEETTLQNIIYHLNKFEEAGLVETIGTVYSKQGREMAIYAPTNDPLVVAAGRESRIEQFRRFFKEIVGALAILTAASLLIDRVLRQGSDAGGTGSQVLHPTQHPVNMFGFSPGFLFLAGGLFVLLLVVGWFWYTVDRE